MGNNAVPSNKHQPASSASEHESQTSSEFENPAVTSVDSFIAEPSLARAAGNIQRIKTQGARRQIFRTYTRRFGNNYVARLAQQLHLIQRQPETAVQRETDEATAIEEAKTIAPGWMKMMVQQLAAMELEHLTAIQKVTEAGKVPGIDSKRLAAAIDAAMVKKTSSTLKPETIDWLKKNAVDHTDQVIEIRDAVGLALFEPAFIELVKFFGEQIQQKRADYDKTIGSKTVATDKDTNAADPKADNENRRKATEKAYKDSAPLLSKLKDITKGRDARYKGDPKSEDTILAALQLEIEFNAEGVLANPADARADAAKAVGMDKSIEWCGAFVAKNYLQSEMVSKMLPGFPSTERLEPFFHYQQYIGTEPTWVYDAGEWKALKDYHTERGSSRKWIDDKTIFSQGKSGDLDIRPGDVVLLDNNPDDRAEIEVADDKDPTKKIKKTVKSNAIPAGATIIRQIPGEKADHVQMVQSWNPATRELFVIEGNADGYIIDTDPAHPAPKGETDAQRKKREELEAASGQKLTTGKDFSHVAVGMNDLASQPDPSKLAAKRSARVYGIGRLSIVDFETQTYNNSKTKPKNPPKAAK